MKSITRKIFVGIALCVACFVLGMVFQKYSPSDAPDWRNSTIISMENHSDNLGGWYLVEIDKYGYATLYGNSYRNSKLGGAKSVVVLSPKDHGDVLRLCDDLAGRESFDVALQVDGAITRTVVRGLDGEVRKFNFNTSRAVGALDWIKMPDGNKAWESEHMVDHVASTQKVIRDILSQYEWPYAQSSR